MNAALLAAELSLAIWLVLLLGHGRFWRATSLDGDDVPAQWPDICVVIPARNEADMLPATLPTLLTHEPPLRIVLVDDRSEDETAAVAERIAQQCSASDRLSVVKGQPLRGWKGKVSAMQRGLEHIAESGNRPRYVLFTDADIAYDKGALAHLVAHAEANNLVLASYMVLLRCKSVAEQWLVPAFVYFFAMLYPFARVNNPAGRTAAAAGGCMLVRYDTLMNAGGLAPIRDALIDDCALGRLMKKQGRIWLGLTQAVRSMRAYPGISDIRAMVSRSAYDQLGYSPLNLLGTLMGLALIFIAPMLLALFGNGSAQLLGGAAWASMSASFMPMLRYYNRSPFMSVTLPVIAAVYMAFTLDSALQYRQGRGGLWKGRAQAQRGNI